MQELFDLHSPDGPERCGLILEDGSIVEIDNIHPDPLNGFAMPMELVSARGVHATWHTHPRTGPNLSVQDYKAFRELPKLRHYVVALTEIWCYGMAGDILVSHDNHHFIRPPKGPLPGANPG